MRRGTFAHWLTLLGLTLALPCAAQPGFSSQKLVLGTSLPMTGPQALQGTELVRGLRLGIAHLNTTGGVAGRLVELVAKDDGGQAGRTIANTRALVAEGVLALTGYYGAAAVEAALSVIESAGVPLIGVASSIELLREPVRPLIFNLRAGLREEAAAVVTQLDTMGVTEIAAISQDDALGRGGREGLQIELARLAMRPVVQVQVPSRRNEVALQRAVESACKDRPHVIMLLLDAPNAHTAIRQARRLVCTKQFYVMNEAGTQLLSDGTLSRELAGVIVPQVVPNPSATALPVVADYARQAVRDGLAPSYIGLEGYLYARLVGEALQHCGRDVSRRCLIASLESRPLDVGGYRVQFSRTDHRGSRFVEMTLVSSDGRLRR